MQKLSSTYRFQNFGEAVVALIAVFKLSTLFQILVPPYTNVHWLVAVP